MIFQDDISIVGKRFFRVVVASMAPRGYRQESQVNCLCDCGKRFVAAVDRLKRGFTRSCGCLRSEKPTADELRTIQKAKNTVSVLPRPPQNHFQTAARALNPAEYDAWRDICSKCTNTNHAQWASHGGQGIRICERWADSFENFLADVGHKPGRLYVFARIDRGDDYKPGNAKWMTYTERSKTRRLPYSGPDPSIKTEGTWFWRGRERKK